MKISYYYVDHKLSSHVCHLFKYIYLLHRQIYFEMQRISEVFRKNEQLKSPTAECRITYNRRIKQPYFSMIQSMADHNDFTFDI